MVVCWLLHAYWFIILQKFLHSQSNNKFILDSHMNLGLWSRIKHPHLHQLKTYVLYLSYMPTQVSLSLSLFRAHATFPSPLRETWTIVVFCVNNFLGQSGSSKVDKRIMELRYTTTFMLLKGYQSMYALKACKNATI